ncbi:MAG: GAF domain-containing protein [Anaerolineales bacterium]|nr:GAF domain-containing protein [Anaerolineales bacterium]
MTFYEIKWGIRWLGMYLLLTIFSGFIDGYVTAAFGLNHPPSTTTLFFVLNIAIISSFVFGLGLYLLNLLRFSEVNLENLVVERTNELNNLLGSLEQRVADRTRDLEIVAEVGTATATIQESKRLLQEVVDLTKERFNLYHSHIYLLDDERKNLVLTAGAGEPGRVMAAEGHSIPLDREQSLVARAARERKGVTVNDVTQAPDFLPNPLLPNTRSELAVPMIVGGKVIGVFDIQSDQIGRFTDADVNIQTTLAAQLATSIQNVRSFERARSQAELETLANTIGQKIQQTASIEETLQTAIRELGTAVGASRVKANLAPIRQGDGITASRN